MFEEKEHKKQSGKVFFREASHGTLSGSSRAAFAEMNAI